MVDFHYRAKSWTRPRRVVCKLEWPQGEMFPKISFIVTNSRLHRTNVVKVYNGRGDVENRIKEGKNTLRWDKTSCHRFGANCACLKMGALAYNLLHMLRRFYVKGEGVRRSVEWLIKRLIKIGAGSPITPRSGTFTWPRPSRWPITTGQFLAMADAGFREGAKVSDPAKVKIIAPRNGENRLCTLILDGKGASCGSAC